MGRQPRHKQSSVGCSWKELPLDLARLVLEHLTPQDRHLLALACRAGRQWVQASRKGAFRLLLESQGDLQQACSLLAPQARSLRLLGPGKPDLLTLSLRRFNMPELEELILEDIAVTHRSLSYLRQLPRLSALSLATSCHHLTHRLNADGCLAELAVCTALRALTVINIACEAGLGALTQLTALHLELPDHTPCEEELNFEAQQDYMCENCGHIHDEDWGPMLRANTDWSDRVVVGPALSTLSGLRHLSIDFAGEGEQINTELNVLDLPALTALASLASLALRNMSRTEHTTRLLGAFNALPALRHLEADYEGPAYYLYWPAPPVGHKDAAGRVVALTARNGRQWTLEREVPPAAEE